MKTREAFAKLYPHDDALLHLAENNRDCWMDAVAARHRWAAFEAGTAEERKRIVEMLRQKHEAAKHSHNYYACLAREIEEGEL